MHRRAAGGADGVGDLLVGAGDGDRTDIGLERAVQHVQDHRPAADSASGLPGRREDAMREGMTTIGVMRL